MKPIHERERARTRKEESAIIESIYLKKKKKIMHLSIADNIFIDKTRRFREYSSKLRVFRWFFQSFFLVGKNENTPLKMKMLLIITNYDSNFRRI